MGQDGLGKVSLFRLDACPLDGEAIAVEAQLGQEGDVLRVAVIVVTRISRWLRENRPRQVLQQPEVAINVVPFHLVSSGGSSPQKAFWEFYLHIGSASFNDIHVLLNV